MTCWVQVGNQMQQQQKTSTILFNSLYLRTEAVLQSGVQTINTSQHCATQQTATPAASSERSLVTQGARSTSQANSGGASPRLSSSLVGENAGGVGSSYAALQRSCQHGAPACCKRKQCVGMS